MRFPLALSLSLVLAAGALPTFAQAADDTTREAAISATTLNKDDAGFIYDALQGGLLEIKASELALKRGLTGAERDFAQKMVDDHTAVDDELKTIAKAKGVAVPTALDEKKQKKLDALGKEKDQDFAKAYLDCQVSAHKDAVSAFKSASEDSKDVDVKSFAAKHVPHLEQHLETAKALDKNR